MLSWALVAIGLQPVSSTDCYRKQMAVSHVGCPLRNGELYE